MTKPAAMRSAQGGWRRTADDKVGAPRDPHDDRHAESAGIDQTDRVGDGSHVIAQYPLRRGIPGDASLHDHKDAGDDQNDDDANLPGLSGEPRGRKLCGDNVWIAEIGNGALDRVTVIAWRTGRRGLPQVILDLLSHTLRQGWIEIELARQRFRIGRNQ